MKQIYEKFKKKAAKCILEALLAFFDFVSPVWNFFFLKTPDSETASQASNSISQTVIKLYSCFFNKLNYSVNNLRAWSSFETL